MWFEVVVAFVVARANASERSAPAIALDWPDPSCARASDVIEQMFYRGPAPNRGDDVDQITEARQTCRTCHETKPLTAFDVRTDTGKPATRCRDCRRDYQRQWLRGQRPPSNRSLPRRLGGADMFRCSRCGELKLATEFPPRKRGEPALHSWCRACFAENGAKHYAENARRERERSQRSKLKRETDVRQRLTASLADRACIDCGERDPDMLTFELSDRTMTFRGLVHSGWCWERISAAISGGAILCRGCRRRRSRPAIDSLRTVQPRTRTPSYVSLNDTPDGRTCIRCGQLRPLEAFAPKYRELRQPSSYCRSCQSAYHKEWYRRNRERQIARARAYRARTEPHQERTIVRLDARRRRWLYLLAHPCVDCGERDPLVLEFDHRSEKRAGIMDLMRKHAPWAEILAEIEKCDVRCANCHRRRTAQTLGYHLDLQDPTADIVPLDARRQRWNYLLAHPCVDCGEADPVVLEFDHRANKRAQIVDLMRRHASWTDVLAEIQQCDVRCANCHRRRTANARGHYRELAQLKHPDETRLSEPRLEWDAQSDRLRPRTGTIRRPADSKSAALSN